MYARRKSGGPSAFDLAVLSSSQEENRVSLLESLKPSGMRQVKTSSLTVADILDDFVVIGNEEDTTSPLKQGPAEDGSNHVFVTPPDRHVRKFSKVGRMGRVANPVSRNHASSSSASVSVGVGEDMGGVQTSLFKFFADNGVLDTPADHSSSSNSSSGKKKKKAPLKRKTSNSRSSSTGKGRKKKAQLVGKEQKIQKKRTVAAAPSMLLKMRQKNLSTKSNSELLLNLLLRRDNPQLQAMAKVVLPKPLQEKRKRKLRLTVNGVGISCDARTKQRTLDGYISRADSGVLMLCTHMLSLGADPNFRDVDGNDALLLALQYRKSTALVTLLLQHGAVPGVLYTAANERCSHTDVALRMRDSEHIQLLLGRKCLPTVFSCPSVDGEEEDDEGVRISLLDYAEVEGFRAQAVQALSAGFLEALLDGDTTVMQDCLRHGLEINHEYLGDRNKGPKTALYLAIEDKTTPLEVITFLLQAGADPNCRDRTGNPVCCLPILRNSLKAKQTIALLLKHNMDVSTIVPLDEGDLTLSQFAEEYAVQASVMAMLCTEDADED
jgi:ankyrin repeat protein